MSVARKIVHRTEVLKGAVMQTIGRVTGSRRLRASGRRVQAVGNARLFRAKIKDALKR